MFSCEFCQIFKNTYFHETPLAVSSFIIKPSEAATRGVLFKKVFLEISQNSQENACARASFLIKLQAEKILSEIN